MNVIDGQAGLVNYSSLIFYSLTINNILNIVVLLILAGITISLVFSDNGIIKKAQEAANKTKEAVINEQTQMNEIADYMENMLNEIGGTTPDEPE